jgi:WD40 repeat protein
LGLCHFPGDGRSVRLAAGSAIVEFYRDGGARRLAAGDSPVSAFCESGDGLWLVSGHADGAVQLWFEDEPRRRFPAHRGEVVDVVFIDAKHFSTAGRDGTVRLWHVTHGRCQAVFVARSALAAIDAARRGGRLLVLDVQGNGYWLRLCSGGGTRPQRRQR